MAKKVLLGFDLGASSGRAVLGWLEDGRLCTQEVHRFGNEPVRLNGELVWDLPRLVFEMKQALALAARQGAEIVSIGIDTWGSDFGLLDEAGHLIGLPVHYRDSRNNAAVIRSSWKALSREACYRLTGSAYENSNTAMQLYSMRLSSDPRLDRADRLLFMSDLLAWALTGNAAVERTIASTSQLMDPGTGDWCDEVLEAFGIPRRLLPELPQDPGTLRGSLLEDIASECGTGRVPVLAVGGHDTACAVAAVPASESSFAFLSSGTISLLGAVVPHPVRTKEALEANYTNECCVDGSTRLLNNISGLWTLQECRRTWARQGEEFTWNQLVGLARQAVPYRAVIDVDDPLFYPPGDMPGRIRQYCAERGQWTPSTPGETVCLILEGLALRYRHSLEQLEGSILKKHFSTLYVVGGGSRNALLDQLAADCTGKTVVAGPGEATVIGNLLVQARAAGLLEPQQDLREIVRASFETKRFEPCGEPGQEQAYARLKGYMDERIRRQAGT